MQDHNPLNDFINPYEIPVKFPSLNLTAASMRWMLRQRAHTGLDACVRKFGRKIMIHLPSFTDWLMSRPSR